MTHMIDPAVIGTVQPERTIIIERGRLQMFALATGQLDPIYTDPDEARKVGHPDLPVPPTFFFGLNLGRGPEEDMRWLRELGIDVRHILHGQQSFRYHALAHAGDTLVLRPRIANVFSKRGGALQFVVRETAICLTDGTPVADLSETIAVRAPRADASSATGEEIQ